MPKKVLVVDDELDMRTFIATLLESSGYTVASADNGQAGLERVRSSKPDLITLDVMMPHESGISMYRDVKLDPELNDIPVLIISGLSKKTFLHSQKVLDKFKNQTLPEPDGYIEKPPEPEEIMDELNRILG